MVKATLPVSLQRGERRLSEREQQRVGGPKMYRQETETWCNKYGRRTKLLLDVLCSANGMFCIVTSFCVTNAVESAICCPALFLEFPGNLSCYISAVISMA